MTFARIFPKVIVVCALLAPFLFPWPFAVALMILAGAYEPLAAVACGLVADALYYAHGLSSVPYLTLLGVAVAVISVFVRKFVETRIIGR